MKKYLSFAVLALVSIAAVGCGCDNENKLDDNKDNTSSKPTLVEDSRSEKEFEKLSDTLVFAKIISGYEFVVTIYFEDEKPINGVVQVKCPDENTALSYYSAHYNSSDYTEVVRDGTLVSYDYSQDFFDENYKDKSKDEIIVSIEGQGFPLVK